MSLPEERLLSPGRKSRQMVRLISAVLAGLVPVLFSVMLQLTTGEPLPRLLEPYVPRSWPAVAVLALFSAGLTAWPMRRSSDAGSAASPGPPVATTPTPSELPRAIADFTGRSKELADLGRRLGKRIRGAKIISIDGKAGVGKSALAIRLAHQLVPRFPMRNYM